MLGISSSDEKLERAKAMGMDAGLNYRDNPDWDRWVMEQTGGEGVDLVVEVGGGDAAALAEGGSVGGTVAQVGVLAENAEPISDLRDFAQDGAHSRNLRGFAAGFCGDEQGGCGWGRCGPMGERVSWTQAREVLTRMRRAATLGRWCCRWGEVKGRE